MRLTIALGAAALASAVPAVAAPAPGSRQPREYVQAAGHSDAFELLEATTALAQSTDPQVRAFAQQMLQDHHGTSDSLRQATASDGLAPPPMGLSADQAPLLAALQSLRGAEFDKAYWRQQALSHRAALVTAQRYAAQGDDPAGRQAAAGAVPVISAHLATAERSRPAA